MMKLLLLLAVALLVVACAPDLPPLPKSTTSASTTTSSTAAPSTTPSASPSTAKSSTASSTTAATSATTGGTASGTTGSVPSGAAQAGDNPRRIHQLRELEHGEVAGGSAKIDAWLMDDDSKQQEGMMWLTERDVKDNQGMLFVFGSPAQQSFWMQNTLIPLDIIYMDAKGKVLNIVHGKPRDESPLPSTGPAQYVLELKDGMAAKYRIGPGTTLTIPANAKYKPADNAQQPGGVTIPGQ